jgi:hypothetical protein
MVISPLIERELQRALRKRWPHRVRVIAAIGSCLLAFFAYAASNQFPTPSASGRWLFFTISTVILILCAFSGPLLTSLSLREEKRTRMLDLLLLSKVGPLGILLSKLLTHSNPTIQILLSSLPIVAIPMLLGGVSSAEVYRMGILCLSTLALSSITGLYAASVCHSGKSAAILSGMILATTSLGSYIVDRIGSGVEGVYALPGLIQAFATTSDLAQGISPLTFWTSIQSMIVLTGGFFVLAIRQLPRATLDEAPRLKPKLWSTFAGNRTLSATRRYQSIRRNPTKWLGSKRQWNPLPAFLFIVTTMLMIAGFLYLQTWFRLPKTHLHLLAFPFLAHTVFKFMLTAKATQLISECRRTGEMEILLSTPLRTDKIYSGFRTATLNGFRKLILFVILTDVATLVFSSIRLNASGQDQILWMLTWGMIVMLAVDTWALLWIGLWEGSRSKNTINAYFRTLRTALVYPLIGFLATVGFAPVMFAYTPTPGNEDSLLVGAILWWWIVGFLIKAPLTFSAIRSLSDHFRSAISAEAIPLVTRQWFRSKSAASH